jgi:hypothetical protein
MVFRRRERRGFWGALREGVWPRAGWRRAVEYVRHRIRRLPDTPEKIARGVAAGVFASFTPLFGLHFILSLLVAKVIRGNMLAALIGTFFGNPLTFVPIALVSMNLGHVILGSQPDAGSVGTLSEAFSGAGRDLWHNLLAVFGPEQTDWSGLVTFWDRVFLPYMVGGVFPGVIMAAVSYWLTVPLVRAYQERRRKRLGEKMAALGRDGGASG